VYALAWHLSVMARVLEKQGNVKRALDLYDEILALARQETHYEMHVYLFRCYKAMSRLGDRERARAFKDQLAQWIREAPETNQIHLLTVAGHLACDDGDYAQARAIYNRMIIHHQRSKNRSLLANLIESHGVLASLEEHYERASRLFGAAEGLVERRNRMFTLSLVVPEDYNAAVASCRPALTEAVLSAAWAEGGAMTLEEAIAYAMEDPEPG
jgi:tetratricopeptide (TPR) repeat protein